MPRLTNILVANRGEIALRVMRSARARGYRVSAIYSDVDADAPHVRFADAAARIGRAELAESYLSIHAILTAAKALGADAVHPGYGLLSEDAEFARACADAGLVFIGPPPATIEAMGDKRRARIAMRAAGVPCVPGYDGEAQDDATLAREAAAIGYPLMVKAAAGGGGRGMRRVEAPEALADALERARSEAEHAFGDGRLILERALSAARHVELQIFADSFGRVLYLGERDCSVQRRFQKLIEEAPSPAVDAALRQRLGEAAVLAAQSSGYVGAGTVEFLLEPNGHFYFLEMNTRLQVEHAVTECLTGIDLVAWQLAVAEGERLPLTQDQVRLSGHAIEVRLYAEDPVRNFLPGTGRVIALDLPAGEGIRIDHALCEGLAIGSHYDAMLGKLIAHGADREQARARLLAALARLRLLGVRTNQDFLRALLGHERFIAGTATTDFLANEVVADPSVTPSPRAVVGAAVCQLVRKRASAAYAPELAGFSNCHALEWPLVLETRGTRYALGIEPAAQPDAFAVVLGSTAAHPRAHARVRILEQHAQLLVIELDGVREQLYFAADDELLWVHSAFGTHAYRDVTHEAEHEQERSRGRAFAPMDGSVISVAVERGQRVTLGQTLCVVAAMKLELRVAADQDGIVKAVHAAHGDQVKARQLLIEISSEAQAPSSHT